MKILWVGPNYLHPTTKGGQIRSLNTLREIRRRHEVHYLTFESTGDREGPGRASEYSTRCQAVPLRLPRKGTLPFLAQLVGGILSARPVSVSRYTAEGMRRRLADACRDESFDCIVCDFLAVADNFPSLRGVTLFQHNVEAEIWNRRVTRANGWTRGYLRLQANRMIDFEKKACRESDMVITVSEKDSETIQSWYGLSRDRLRTVPTGVDVDYFRKPASPAEHPAFDLVFIGSMDWSPNEDAMRYFLNEVLPLIRRARGACTLAIVGRTPSESLRRLAEAEPGVTVTGTVPDVRPYLWGARASIVPIRIGGGTRLKIYESAAAGTPVVSTTIGAEGLALEDGQQIFLADTPAAFVEKVCRLLEDPSEALRLSEAALRKVSSDFSWASIAHRFEEHLLEAAELRRDRLRTTASVGPS